MTPEEFRAALDSLCWSPRDAASILEFDDRTLRRMYAGKVAVPDSLAAWLGAVLAAVKALPHDRDLWTTKPIREAQDG